MKKVLSVIAVLLLSVGTAGATSVTGLYDTGVDDSGARLGLNVLDTHWGVSYASLTNGNANTTVEHANWIAADPNTQGRWITPVAYASTESPSTAPEGDYIYEIRYNITGLTAGFHIDGYFASDNPTINVYSNNTQTGITGDSYGSLIWFSITSGFVEGDNYIRFYINNGSDSTPWIPGANPTGLLVDFTDPSPVPIPPAVWLFGSGIVGLIGLKRRIRK